MIKFEKVSKTYRKGNVVALDGIDLSIDQGDFVFLVGESGAGKTTMFKLLIREELPSEGEVWFHDQDVVRLSGRKVANLRRRIGMVFQDFRLLGQNTVFENVSFVLEVIGKKDSEIREVVPYLLEQVGLYHRRGAFPKELSTGEQQRVAIARALALEPEVLLADEPTGNLDEANTRQILDLLKQINEWGTTVLMATHDMGIVKEKGARVISLEKGKIKEEEK